MDGNIIAGHGCGLSVHEAYVPFVLALLCLRLSQMRSHSSTYFSTLCARVCFTCGTLECCTEVVSFTEKAHAMYYSQHITLKHLRVFLQHNLVSSLTALSALVRLRHLDISHNAISSLTPLSGLTSMEQLCMDSNSVTSLTPLSALSSLMELYAAHNAVTATHAFSPLDELPKLYVADFRGTFHF
jgi:uncharacterized membrane protein